MITEKTTTTRWLDWLFGHVTGSDTRPEKNSCEKPESKDIEKIFSLSLTRQELVYLRGAANLGLSFHGTMAYSVHQKMCQALEKDDEIF